MNTGKQFLTTLFLPVAHRSSNTWLWNGGGGDIHTFGHKMDF